MSHSPLLVPKSDPWLRARRLSALGAAVGGGALAAHWLYCFPIACEIQGSNQENPRPARRRCERLFAARGERLGSFESYTYLLSLESAQRLAPRGKAPLDEVNRHIASSMLTSYILAPARWLSRAAAGAVPAQRSEFARGDLVAPAWRVLCAPPGTDGTEGNVLVLQREPDNGRLLLLQTRPVQGHPGYALIRLGWACREGAEPGWLAHRWLRMWHRLQLSAAVGGAKRAWQRLGKADYNKWYYAITEDEEKFGALGALPPWMPKEKR